MFRQETKPRAGGCGNSERRRGIIRGSTKVWYSIYMKIYITGVSGTGKISLSRELIARGINAVDLDEISHWENKETGDTTGWEPGSSDEWMESHIWVCDLIKLKEVLSKAENAVALGHASNQDEYLPLFDKTFVLSCSPETIVKRLNDRTDNDFGKHPKDQERILNWQRGFDNWMIEKGAEVINCERPIDEIIAVVESHFS